MATDRQDKSVDSTRARIEPIAIVGVGCRFPGANDPDAFWDLLRTGSDAISEIPDSRWPLSAYYDPDPNAPGKIYTRYAGLLDSVDGFDAELFRVSAREARAMDPQQRLLLEVAWEALESAGIAPDGLAGTPTGVFVGISNSEYTLAQLTASPKADIEAHSATGGALSVAAGRLSYVLGLSGPCVAVDTACSSGLVAVQLACESLLTRSSDLALAGGVNVILSPDVMVSFCKTRMMAADGRCKTFDARADGYVRGEGCGVVVLKRLADAAKEGNRILAVIRGWAVNQDGRSNGLTAPSGPAQEAVIGSALNAANVRPNDVSYVEAHGTGTALGDPIEMKALVNAYGRARSAKQPLVIGSVKTNIGHLEAAAGLAGLIKVVMALIHQEIPPNLHFDTPTPRIPWHQIPVAVATGITRWPSDGTRLAAVSSFGFSGTNVHMIVGEGTRPADRRETEKEPRLAILSARTETSLRRSAAGLSSAIQAGQHIDLGDLCWTCAAGRARLGHRLAFVAESLDEAQASLDQYLSGDETAVDLGRIGVGPTKIAFLFTGQGSQYLGMGRELFDQEGIFRATFLTCAEWIERHYGWSLISLLFSDRDQHRIDQTAWGQPALYALQCALVELWRSWGVEPNIVVGHSVGEYAAAFAAKVFSLTDGLRLVAERGRLMQKLTCPGSMLAVRSSEAGIADVLGPYSNRVSIAAVNAPEAIVLSGDSQAIAELHASLAGNAVYCFRLNTSHAFHSPLMDPMLSEFHAVASQGDFLKPSIPMISCLHGRLHSTTIAPNADYWTAHIREPVRFMEAIAALNALECRLRIEIGPKPTLVALARLTTPSASWSALPSLNAGIDARRQMLSSAGKLYVQGVSLNWQAIFGDPKPHFIQLPTYPFERSRYWFNHVDTTARDMIGRPPAERRIHPLLGRRISSPLQALQFEAELNQDATSYLRDHRVSDIPIMPAAGFIEIMLAAIDHLGSPVSQICDVEIVSALHLLEAGSRRVQTILTSKDPNHTNVEILSLDAGDNDVWTSHAYGCLVRGGDHPAKLANPEEIKARCTSQATVDQAYRQLRDRGLSFGPTFRTIQAMWYGNREALARIEEPKRNLNAAGAGVLAAALLDGGFQVFASAALRQAPEERHLFLPAAIAKITVHVGREDPRWVHANFSKIGESDRSTIEGSLHFYDESGRLVLEMDGVVARRVSASPAKNGVSRGLQYKPVWQPGGSAYATSSLQVPRNWLVLTDGSAVGQRLCQRLRSDGDAVVTVSRGEQFQKADDDHFVLNPQCAQDYRKLVAECTGRRTPSAYIHLWTDDEPERSGTKNRIPKGVNQCMSVTNLMCAIAHTGTIGLDRLWIVTRAAQAASPEDTPPDMAKAMLWGLGRVASLEHPTAWGGLIDLPGQPFGNEIDSLISVLRSGRQVDQIAIRPQGELVLRLQRCDPPSGKSLRRFVGSSDARYLVTGGFGALGMQVADWLASSGARRLVLLGRKPTRPRAEWPHLLSDSSDAGRIAFIQRLEKRGVTVETPVIDFNDEPGLAASLMKLLQNGPPIRGVFHTAGILNDATLLNVTEEAIASSAAPKCAAAWNLHQLLSDQPIDHFVMFSSVAGLLGSPGQASYAAANAALDALAFHRTMLGLPALSIAWGAWQGPGMSARRLPMDGPWRRLLRPLSSADATAAMEDALEAKEPYRVIADIDWKRWPTVLSSARQLPIASELVADVSQDRSTTSHAGTDIRQADPAARRELVVEFLRRGMARVLGWPPGRIDITTPLTNIGLDSLSAIEFKNTVETEIQVKLSLKELLGGQSIVDIAQGVLQSLDDPSLETKADLVTASESDRQPLSRGQKALWFVQQFAPDSAAYNVGEAVRIRGPLNEAALRSAFERVVARHSMLRTVFTAVDGVPYQQHLTESNVDFVNIESSDWPADNLGRALSEEINKPFDLQSAPALRVRLYRLASDLHVLLIVLHHLIEDFWSLVILMNEIGRFYRAETSYAEVEPLPDLPFRYADYVNWQIQSLAGDEGKRHRNYWREKLAIVPPPLDLPTDRPRPKLQTFNGAYHYFELGPELSERIEAFARLAGVTLYTVLVTAFAVLLRRLSGQDSLVVGAVMSNRGRREFRDIIGYFDNLVPLHVKFTAGTTFEVLLKQVAQTVLEAIEHEAFPFPSIIESISIKRDPSRTPLIDAVFVLRKAQQLDTQGLTAFALGTEGARMTLGGLPLESVQLERRVSQFDLTLAMAQVEGLLSGSVEYNTDLFDASTISAFVDIFENGLETMVSDPNVTVPVLRDESTPCA
jgi:acyl transferase domain-containing protein/NADP-dependent 3-hydroxy acid dehydrogenase YdfG/acyl carrier protein